MLKLSIPAALALAMSAIAPAKALPVCYMETTEGAIVDLSYMCGNEGARNTAQASIESTLPPAQDILDTESQIVGRFEVNKRNYLPLIGDTIIYGTAVFDRGVATGSEARPCLNINGFRYCGDEIIKRRGQQEYPVVSVRVIGDVSLEGLLGELETVEE